MIFVFYQKFAWKKFGESFAKQSDHATYQNDKKSRDFSYPANWRVDIFFGP